jgi:ribosomal protein L3
MKMYRFDFGSKCSARRKVACIGPWKPMKVLWTIARAENNGFHHSAVIILGGITEYGQVKNDLLLIQG